MPKKRSKPQRAQIDFDRCVVQHSYVGYGITQFTCLWESHFGPLGVVWAFIYATKAGTAALIVDSFVTSWARRAGVRSFINKAILKQAKIVYSSDASNPDGIAFMKARGYRHVKSMGAFALTKKGKP